MTCELGLDEYPETHGLGRGRDANCDDPLFEGLDIEVDQAIAYPGDGCFVDNGAAVLADRSGILMFGAGEALTNDQVLRADNAAVALRLLGQKDDLVWYVPTFEDLAGADEVGLGPLLPRWLEPGAWLVLVAAGFLVIWRARRLGPLATEPLPVVVKAHRDHPQPRPALPPGRRPRPRRRGAAGRRAAPASPSGFGWAPTSTRPTLIADVARHTGRTPTRSARPFGPAARSPSTDHDLITLASDLAELDERCERTPMTRRPSPRPRTRPPDARERLVAVRREVAKAVVGQDAAVSGLLVALLCGGHVLMEGVPGRRRRCSYAPSPGRCRSRPGACSSPPT